MSSSESVREDLTVQGGAASLPRANAAPPASKSWVHPDWPQVVWMTEWETHYGDERPVGTDWHCYEIDTCTNRTEWTRTRMVLAAS